MSLDAANASLITIMRVLHDKMANPKTIRDFRVNFTTLLENPDYWFTLVSQLPNITEEGMINCHNFIQECAQSKSAWCSLLQVAVSGEKSSIDMSDVCRRVTVKSNIHVLNNDMKRHMSGQIFNKLLHSLSVTFRGSHYAGSIRARAVTMGSTGHLVKTLLRRL
eukprot:6248792-Amphidinium_carterae.1